MKKYEVNVNCTVTKPLESKLWELENVLKFEKFEYLLPPLAR